MEMFLSSIIVITFCSCLSIKMYPSSLIKSTLHPKTKDVQMVVLSWDRRLSTKDFGDLKTYYFKGKKQ